MPRSGWTMRNSKDFDARQGQGRFLAEPGSDASVLLQDLKKALGARFFPKNTETLQPFVCIHEFQRQRIASSQRWIQFHSSRTLDPDESLHWRGCRRRASLRPYKSCDEEGSVLHQRRRKRGYCARATCHSALELVEQSVAQRRFVIESVRTIRFPGICPLSRST